MRFKSTRGGVEGTTFEDAISQGYAPDGGLFVPERLPQIGAADLQRWRGLSFEALALEILTLFVGDELPAAELAEVARGCYADFACGDVVPLVRVGDLLVAELFHGPTFCFKDLGQQPLVRLLARFAEKRGLRRTMLVSTTGDTGPAAMRAVSDAGSSSLGIVVFYPDGQISELQRRQMSTAADGCRARVAPFEGGGDDMDLPLKRLGADRAFAEEHGLCGINSYNLGRPVAQTVFYFWTYFRALDERGLATGAEIDIALPSGALGNLAAGFMSKLMGLPVRKLIAGVNSNDITHRTISSGDFSRSERMEKTLSDAINIQVPYNMERILYYLTGEDAAQTAAWYAEIERTGSLALPEPWLARLRETFASSRVDDAAMCAALRRGLQAHGYLCDPHTAVGLAAAWAALGPAGSAVPMVVLATAAPCKFQAAITEAVGAEAWAAFERSERFPEAARRLMSLPERLEPKLARQGPLEASQAAWEAQVRAMIGQASARL